MTGAGGKLTDRTTSLIRMTGVFRAELDGRIQRLYSSSKNCEQEWMSTPARCFLQGMRAGSLPHIQRGRAHLTGTPTNPTANQLQMALNRKAGGNLELAGDVGGETGAGTSTSSSSSSSHSSSRRGVMLFPSHTEWMDTFNRYKPLGSVLSPGGGPWKQAAQLGSSEPSRPSGFPVESPRLGVTVYGKLRF